MTRKAHHDLSTSRGRVWALLHFYLKDHHILRVWWWNLHQIAPGVWRSNQPSPKRLKYYKGLGIRSVVSLRGNMRVSFNLFEEDACAALGMEMRNVTGVTARSLQPAKTILKAVDAVAKAQKPVVFHCKSGADRTGFVAAIYLIVHEGVAVDVAARQLARRYIHFPRSAAGVLDHVFRVYQRDAELKGVAFRHWLETDFTPREVEADFADWRTGAGRWAT